jgi:hypothetical protein
MSVRWVVKVLGYFSFVCIDLVICAKETVVVPSIANDSARGGKCATRPQGHEHTDSLHLMLFLIFIGCLMPAVGKLTPISSSA